MAAIVARGVEGLAERARGRLLLLRGAAATPDPFLVRASESLDALKALCTEDKENANPSNLLELYTQAILDMTYFEENKLVDEDFPGDSLQKVKELISVLSEPEILAKESNLHPEDLSDGIHFLLKMFTFRCPIQLSDGVNFQDIDTAKLLSEGIYSDTHLLAMMYVGEMCYWGLKYCGHEKAEHNEEAAPSNDLDCSVQKEIVDFREIGERILKRYVSVCEGSLQEQGWNTTNAKRILDFFWNFAN
uniref:RAB7A interacting MON1-CCZ1 complex subunit 1 n=1 Tax=Ornithorhynchus anatinus TaxID=9258 RepID=A0A6I8PIM2_ORNAN